MGHVTHGVSCPVFREQHRLDEMWNYRDICNIYIYIYRERERERQDA